MTQYSGKIIRKTPVSPTQTSASGVWTVIDAATATKNNTWPVAGVPDPISRSVRFRASASAYFSRTPSSASNRRTWTWSGWVKRGTLGTAQWVFDAFQDASNFTAFFFNADNTFGIQYVLAGTSKVLKYTTQVFRDPSAWYHIIVAIDTTPATPTFTVYINGSQVTSFGTNTNTVSQNEQLFVNTTNAHNIGRYGGAGNYFDGYLTEINFIDGQALTSSSFGTTDSITGAWIPMPYTGTYGTNGFYLNFKDNTSTTTIGYEYSGNGNNWTANNISLTTGATYDSMVDVPTLWMPYNTTGDTGALVRGNYCVLNPIAKSTRITTSAGNLSFTGDGTSNHQIIYGTFPITTGKWYWEIVTSSTGASPVNIAGIQSYIGFADGTYVTSAGNGCGWGYNTLTGQFYASNFTASGTAPVFANGTIAVAYDADAGKVWFRNTSGAWIQGDPATGASATFTLSGTATTMMPAVSVINTSAAWTFNFGQQPFTYTPPTGFKSLNTFNLSAPTIRNGANYMAATLYTGNGTSQTISNTVNGISFQPDFVWAKCRSTTYNHLWVDVLRGTTNYLFSNSTAADTNSTTTVTSFNSNGFSIGTDVGINNNTSTFVGWQWKANGAGVSNTSGSITSTVSASTTAGFSIATFNVGASGAKTFGHGLGVAPKMVIVKSRTSALGWCTYHASVTTTTGQYLQINTTGAILTVAGIWGSTLPTSTVVGIGSGTNVNANDDCVAYCFAEVAGYSAFGSYTGNASADGPFVYCGFRPRFVLIKVTNAVNSWILIDSSRDTYNSPGNYLLPNSSGAEGSVSPAIDLLSNGFKLRLSNTGWNGSGEVIAYAAFAENPFKYSNAR